MRILEIVTYAAVAFHFIRLSLRALAMGIHQAFDTAPTDLAQGLGLTKMVKRNVPTNKEGTEFKERDVQVANPEAVTWLVRLRVLGAQFLAN